MGVRGDGLRGFVIGEVTLLANLDIGGGVETIFSSYISQAVRGDSSVLSTFVGVGDMAFG